MLVESTKQLLHGADPFIGIGNEQRGKGIFRQLRQWVPERVPTSARSPFNVASVVGEEAIDGIALQVLVWARLSPRQ